MVIILTGASHTEKTFFAQKLLEKYHYPCISIDLLKMGLIRNKQTNLTPKNDDKLVPYLWNIVKEIIKTSIENKQNLIIEGCYIPFSWEKNYTKEELSHIRYTCLVMSKEYITKHYKEIKKYASVIEKRCHITPNKQELIKENTFNFDQCQKYNLPYTFITDTYPTDINL